VVTRRLPLLLLTGLALLVAATRTPPARAEEKPDPGRLLLEAARRDLPLATRLKSVARVLATRGDLDADLAVQAGASLMAEAPGPAGWLMLRGVDAGYLPGDARRAATEAVEAAWSATSAGDAAARAQVAAVGLLLGRRGEGQAELLTDTWPPSDFVHAVLRRELGHLRDSTGALVLEAGAAAVRSALAETQATAALLDQATEDDPEVMRAGLDGLMAQGANAVPLLLHEAEQGALGEPVGRMARAARAILALGQLHDRRATPVLARCLLATDGWVRVSAATALGDLGDPAGAPPLAVHLATAGDLFRVRDQWDYPGTADTTVPESEWATVDYFVVDCAAADSLMRLGAPNAAGYLVEEKLDPSKANSRIRVFQDAVDALRRSLPQLEATRYNVDAGLPYRDRAFAEMAHRWHALRDKLPSRIDEDDPGFRKAARELAERLRGTDIRTFMITKPACALLGRCMTPTLIETLAAATKGSACAELAETLGMVRDPRAVPTLLALLKDERPYVRARAAEALGTYVEREEVLAALLALLQDPKQGPRISALKGLVGARPNPAVLAAVRANRPERVSNDWTLAETVLLLVQEGEQHWAPIEQGLSSQHRYEREEWWRMLRTALDLPAYLHDAKALPDARHVRRVTKEVALARLAERRAP